jgi:hypothetical protein
MVALKERKAKIDGKIAKQKNLFEKKIPIACNR